MLDSVRRDRALRRRPGGAAHLRVRLRDRRAARRAGDPRPARPGAPRDGVRRAVPVLAARGLVHALGSTACRTPCAACSRSSAYASGRVAHEFKLPDLGEGLTEAEIARWLVAEGDAIAEDQPLVEVQTDKTTVEIPSPREGTVLKILVEEGEVAPVGAVLVVIGAEGEQLLRAVESAGRLGAVLRADRLGRPVGPDRGRAGDSRGAAARALARRRARRPAGQRARAGGSSRPTCVRRRPRPRGGASPSGGSGGRSSSR